MTARIQPCLIRAGSIPAISTIRTSCKAPPSAGLCLCRDSRNCARWQRRWQHQPIVAPKTTPERPRWPASSSPPGGARFVRLKDAPRWRPCWRREFRSQAWRRPLRFEADENGERLRPPKSRACVGRDPTSEGDASAPPSLHGAHRSHHAVPPRRLTDSKGGEAQAGFLRVPGWTGVRGRRNAGAVDPKGERYDQKISPDRELLATAATHRGVENDRGAPRKKDEASHRRLAHDAGRDRRRPNGCAEQFCDATKHRGRRAAPGQLRSV